MYIVYYSRYQERKLIKINKKGEKKKNEYKNRKRKKNTKIRRSRLNHKKVRKNSCATITTTTSENNTQEKLQSVQMNAKGER